VSFRLARSWGGLDADQIAVRFGVARPILFEVIGSTNDVARAFADQTVHWPLLVIAERQTAGRGRGGKEWDSRPGLGVWMSLMTRPKALPSPGLLPLLVGLAAAEALDGFLGDGDAAQVKWPNDLYIDGRKTGGILCESTWDGDRPTAVVIGIGLNVLHEPEDFPPDVRDTATSLRIATGAEVSRAEVAEAVVRSVLRAVSSPPARLSGSMLDRLRARDVLLGRPIAVTGADEVEGIAMGITPEGALLIRTSAGVLRTVTAGTVRPTGDRVAAD
jgi:BirA family biotin operon repressor/biotin-[acetyl-CoA-carboxylase] ligase